MDKIQNLIGELMKFTKAESVFLYGSRTREGDFYPDSDYEIGVLMKKENYVERTKIKNRFDIKDINIFPFRYENFVAGEPDTPFQKSIYMRDIIRTGKTLAGEKIVENLQPPAISLLDVIQDVRFNLGRAYDATISCRTGEKTTAAYYFSKSCLFGTRSYIIFKKNLFLTSYKNILETSKTLDLQLYQDLPAYAFELREGKGGVDSRNLFLNISYLNKLVEREIVAEFEKEGNKILVE